jgi:hypothetical protein
MFGLMIAFITYVGVWLLLVFTHRFEWSPFRKFFGSDSDVIMAIFFWPVVFIFLAIVGIAKILAKIMKVGDPF